MKHTNSVTRLLLPILVLCAADAGLSQLANTKIAFTSNRDGNEEIYIMNADGTNQTRLTNSSASDHAPQWSPNGEKIAFPSNRDGNFEVYVMNADGTNQQRLTNNPADDRGGSWSPDGNKIAFQSTRDGNWEVHAMNADGTNQQNLSNNPAEDSNPDWSPDGSKIVFESLRDGNYEIYLMNADGTNPQRLTNNAAEDHYPAWSPDGSKIAFQSTRDGNFEVYVMNADGTNEVRITNNSAHDEWARWSPDGSKIVFNSTRDGNYEIYVMNTDGTNQIRLTNNSAKDDFPRWSPFLSIIVSIDIKPGSDPNSIDPNSNGVIPVAILTTQSFDATTVDPLSVRFGPNGTTESHSMGHIEDVDADGDMDLVLHFSTQATGIQCGQTQASLTGETFNGEPITGTDAIQTVGCGSGKVVAQEQSANPVGYALAQNYPNPFNPSTTIEFSLSRPGYTTLKVYDVLGRQVATLVDKHLSAGNHRVEWNASAFGSGVYSYKLTTDDFSTIKKLVLLR